MALPLERLSVKDLDIDNLVTEPNGVLSGDYRFIAQTLSTRVVLKSFKPSQSCDFHVTVQDSEPPKVKYCPPRDVYISLNAYNGPVTWEEPVFEDNVAVTKKLQNMQNGKVLGEQVYYVDYAAFDSFNNEAACRFFVHVKAGKVCSLKTMPGGDGHSTKMSLSETANFAKALLLCKPGSTFSKNMTSPRTVFDCRNGIWEDVPDCVKHVPKTSSICPAGHNTLYLQTYRKTVCAECPKGTKEEGGECVSCPMGTYNNIGGSTSCTKCPQGSDTLAKGQKDITGCRFVCKAGEYSKDGYQEGNGCSRCPKGTFQSNPRQKSCHICPNYGTSEEGSTSSDKCKVPARIDQVIPLDEKISIIEGGSFTIKCNASGTPPPTIDIKSVEPLANATLRGSSLKQQLVTVSGSASVGVKLTVTNATLSDNAVYRCVATNLVGTKTAKDTRDIVVTVVKAKKSAV